MRGYSKNAALSTGCEMSRSFPSLNALRAFEAAARHCSFAKAAEELHVTPTAISHQIKSLEDQLGLALFARLGNRLALTPEGERYMPPLKRAFDGIDRATNELLSHQDSECLVIGVLPNFAIRWLIPRLPAFNAEHKDIEVRLATAQQSLTFGENGVDVAIRAGTRIRSDIDLAEIQSDLLFACELFPVCSPALLGTGTAGISHPDQLAGYTLLHCAPAMNDWRNWLSRWGTGKVDPEKGPRFDSYLMCIEAAVHGIGLAMASYPFVADDLEAGRLVAPFNLTVPQNRAWYLLYPDIATMRRKVVVFRDWILAEVSDNGPGVAQGNSPNLRAYLHS